MPFFQDVSLNALEKSSSVSAQGTPTAAAFAEVIATTDLEAEAAMGDVRWNMSAAEACAVLWPVVRRQAGLPDTEDAPSAWRAALERLMDKPRPEPSFAAGRAAKHHQTTHTPAAGP